MNCSVADINNAIDGDPPEGDPFGHVKASSALKYTSNRLDLIEVSNLYPLGVANNLVSV